MGFFFLGIKRLLVCLDCGCPSRAPSLPSGREPAANWIPGIHFRGLAVPEGLSDCAEASQTVQNGMPRQKAAEGVPAVLGHAGHPLRAGSRHSAFGNVFTKKN